MKRSSLFGWGYFAALVTLASTPNQWELLPVLTVLGAAAGLAWTAAWLLDAGAVVPTIPPIVHGLTYFPGATEAVTTGISWTGPPVSQEGAGAALLLMAAFTCVGSIGGLWLSRTTPFRVLAERAARLMAPGGREPFILGFLTYFSLVTLSAFAAGMWTQYSTTPVGPQRSGGIRLEIEYLGLLSPALLVVLLQTARAYRAGHDRATAKAIPWALVTVVVFLLVFLSQSRRLLIGAVFMALLVANRMVPAGKSNAQGLRRFLWVAFAIASVAAAMVGSHIWRDVATRSQASAPLEQVSDTIDAAAQEGPELESMVKASQERLKYLASDGTCLQYFDGETMPWSIMDALANTAIRVTPGLLAPNKYTVPQMNCAEVLVTHDLLFDWTCTATCNAWLVDGMLGLLVVLAFWGLGLAIAEALSWQGTPGLAMAAAGAFWFSIIETAAFPIIVELRSIIMLTLATLPFGVAARMLGRGGPSKEERAGATQGPDTRA